MSTTTTASPTEAKLWGGGKSPFSVEYGKVMMWYFLMSDAFTFGAFLISYGTVRFSTNGWPDPNVVFKSFPFAPEGINAPLVFVSVMTFILIVSSVTMVLAVHAGHNMDKVGKKSFHQCRWNSVFYQLHKLLLYYYWFPRLPRIQWCGD